MDYTDNKLIDILNNVTDKFHIQILNVCDKKYKNIEFKREFYEQYRYIVCGPLFTTGKVVGEKILKRLNDIFIETTELGYGHGEEMFYLEVLDEFYDDIVKGYGDYHTILNNFITPSKDFNYIIHFILNKYINFGYYRECYDACQKMLDALHNNISSCYYKPEECIKVLTNIFNLIHDNQSIKNIYTGNKNYYDAYFKIAMNLKEKYDVVLCVFGCPTIEKYKNQVLKINETWGKIADSIPNIKLLFFFGEEEDSDLIDEKKYIYLKGVKNDYLSASYKQNLGLQYIYDNYDAKFIFVCGTDTYINIYKLLDYTNSLNENDKLFIGGHGDYRVIDDRNYYFHAGAGFLLSKDCLKYLYKNLWSMTDLWINKCVMENLDLTGGCDVCISYYLQKDNYLTEDKIIKKNNLFVGCNYLGKHNFNFNNGICCGNNVKMDQLISCHFMSLHDFDNFTEILQKNNYFVNNDSYIKNGEFNEKYFLSTVYLKSKYTSLCNDHSNAKEYLRVLNEYATECESILELGVGAGISSWALLNGIINNKKQTKRYFFNDINPCNIDELLKTTKHLDYLKIECRWINDLQLTLNSDEFFDLTFIDTWSVYAQLKRELDKYGKITKKYMIIHNTEIDAVYGETIRLGLNAHKQSQESGFPLDEINCGLQKAIDEFLHSNKDWNIKATYTQNNGLTILEKA